MLAAIAVSVLVSPVAGQVDVLPLTTRGDLLTRNATSIVRLGVGAANRVLCSDGTDPAWCQASLSAGHVTGTLPIGNGGTGQTTATAAFNALDPLTTQGDVLYHNGTDSVRLAAGTATQVLQTGGAGANPSWAARELSMTFASGDAGGFAPADAAVLYVATFYGVDPSTSSSIGGVPFGWTVPKTGRITRVDLTQIVLNVNGINGENIAYVFRKNDTTDSSSIGSLDTDADTTVSNTANLNFSVTAGDVLSVKLTCPTFTTDPSAMFVSISFVLEYP